MIMNEERGMKNEVNTYTFHYSLFTIQRQEGA